MGNFAGSTCTVGLQSSVLYMLVEATNNHIGTYTVQIQRHDRCTYTVYSLDKLDDRQRKLYTQQRVEYKPKVAQE